ncbi:MAG: thiol:disulfide interchange protein DsbA/DsbL [Ectothiorhodospiraceae bacterium AqS1]|nr:thiol:disulfide interchange protein DsbA/DsbL [Ectothiorhodospiraceae bacterium AqS1]
MKRPILNAPIQSLDIRHRGSFFRSTLAIVFSLLFASSGAALAQAVDISDIEGMYETLPQPQPVETGDKIEIVDVFWYGCPGCYQFLPVMEYIEQNLPDYVEVRRLPAIFRDSWLIHAQGYYTAQALDIAAAHHREFFDAIHKEGNSLDTKEAIIDFYSERSGVDKDKLDQTWESFTVNSNINKSLVMQQRYGVRATPTIIVHGKYRVGTTLAGTYQNLIKVINKLAEYEHQAKNGGA